MQASRFQSVRAKLQALESEKKRTQARLLAAGPDVLVGSFHAVTEQGQVLIASATGSQLGAAAWGAARIIGVVGTHKHVRSLEEGMRRIREHCLPGVDLRARGAYGRGSAINKLLVVPGE